MMVGHRSLSDYWARIAREWPTVVIVLLYGVMAATLWPGYHWPVIDAWAFGYSVKQLVESGRYVFVDWGAMSQLAHVAWGALFSLPAGFSFGAVNFSTFVLSLVAMLASYGTLRELSLSPLASFIGAGPLLVNPAFVLLSYSYMTDVPFLGWMTLSTWCDVRGLRRQQVGWLAVGSVFATLAVLIRQNGIALPAALALYLLWQWARRERSFPWREGLAGVGLPAAALALLTALSRLEILPGRTNALAWINLGLVPAQAGAALFRILLYLGLFTLPLTLAAAPAWVERKGDRLLATVRSLILPAVLFLVIGAGAIAQFYHPFKLPYIGTWRMMPYYPSVWSIYGTGSRGEWLAGEREVVFGPRFWAAITAVSCAGAALLLWPAGRHLLSKFSSRGASFSKGDSYPTGFLVLIVAAYLGPVLLFKGEIYERYLIGLLIPIAALVLRAVQRENRRLFWPAFALVGVIALMFSLALTAEFVAWNGAAWRAAGRLAAGGVPLYQLDGGFCWNGWHFAETVRRTNLAPEAGSPAYMELTPQIERRYVVSFSPLNGYVEVGREPYWSALHWGQRELWLLRRP